MEYTPARRRRAGHVLGGPRVKYGLCLEEGFAVKGNHPGGSTTGGGGSAGISGGGG